VDLDFDLYVDNYFYREVHVGGKGKVHHSSERPKMIFLLYMKRGLNGCTCHSPNEIKLCFQPSSSVILVQFDFIFSDIFRKGTVEDERGKTTF
jgi:hypothetical protein